VSGLRLQPVATNLVSRGMCHFNDRGFQSTRKIGAPLGTPFKAAEIPFDLF
jgi:hypothetical protein